MSARAATPRVARAVGYVRVSTGAQVRDGGSLDEQREALAFFAATNGLDLVNVFEDAGISGAKDDDKRPGLAAALEAIRAGEARVLLVRDLSRLARDVDLVGYLRVAVKKAGGTVKVIGESEDRLYRLFDAVKSEMFRTAISERMKLWAGARKAKGLPLGRAPFGYRIGEHGRLEPEGTEYPVVERILGHRRRGLSYRAIATLLTEDGVTSPQGTAWTPATLLKIVRREAGAVR